MRSYPPPPPRDPGEPVLLAAKRLSVFLDCHHKSIYRWLKEGVITTGVYRIGRQPNGRGRGGMLRFDRLLVLKQLQKTFPDRYPFA